MPKGKKEVVEIELGEGEDKEIFEFIPVGPMGVLRILRDETDFSVEKLTEMDADIREALSAYAPVYSDLIFNELLEKCVSHDIVNPENSSEEERENADYWTSDFSFDEQMEIVNAVQGQEEIEEAMEEAESFPGLDEVDR